MPLRAIRASKAIAGSHVKANLRVWAAAFAALSAGFLLLLQSGALGLADIWGDLLVLCAMVLGILIIMISHEGYEAAETADDLPPMA